MRVTAIRVGTDVWRVLESEAARVGVSVSQYVREAALARASAAAAARGESPYELLALPAHNQRPVGRASARHKRNKNRAGRAQINAREARLEAQAVRALSEQVRRRFKRLHDDVRHDDGAT